MVKEAERESEEARARAKGEAMADRVTGKAQSYVSFSILLPRGRGGERELEIVDFSSVVRKTTTVTELRLFFEGEI